MRENNQLDWKSSPELGVCTLSILVSTNRDEKVEDIPVMLVSFSYDLSSVPENENRGESKTNWKVRIRPKLSIFLFFFRMCRDG